MVIKKKIEAPSTKRLKSLKSKSYSKSNKTRTKTSTPSRSYSTNKRLSFSKTTKKSKTRTKKSKSQTSSQDSFDVCLKCGKLGHIAKYYKVRDKNSNLELEEDVKIQILNVIDQNSELEF